MDKKRTPTLVDHKTFMQGRALSFHEQPYLQMLFSEVCNPNLPLTLIVGAGVSMNAGLRSWPELVSQMIDKIEDKRLQGMARADRSDLLRKAEIVLQLIKEHNHNAEDYEIIRDALYQRDMQATPGQLAMSIARLVAARHLNTKLITTNFDTILEEALSRHFERRLIRSFSLGDLDGWRQATLDSECIAVLHVHGVVQQGSAPSKPIVLTESQFFKHSANVRQEIFDNLRDSCALFVGLSMSDPNLVGPIYEMTNQHISSPRFALVVPESAPGATTQHESALYAIESAKFMQRALGLRTVFLKSYSQLNQALSDLTLAIVEPERYKERPRGGASSLIYGKRLMKALDYCYSSIGCRGQKKVPTGEAAAKLNDRLHKALNSPQGPASVLRRFALHMDGHQVGGAAGENFALFLWLRCHYQPRSKSRYALNLVGTSAYIHREAWSVRREIDITRDSNMAAIQAVFFGTPVAVNVDPSPASPIWQGIIALPIVIESTGSDRLIDGTPVDILTIGAITLNSTRRVKDDLVAERTHQQSSTVSTVDQHLSVVTELDSSQMNEVFDSMKRAAATVLLPSN
jgi:hypothetical protein